MRGGASLGSALGGALIGGPVGGATRGPLLRPSDPAAGMAASGVLGGMFVAGPEDEAY